MPSDRPVSVTSPLGPDVLLFHRITVNEALGQLFDFQLEVISSDHSIELETLLGQSMTVHLELPGGGVRHFNGMVSQLSSLGSIGRFAHYGITLQPWLWFLSRTADCRIFQNKTIPDIIKEIFSDFGFSDVEDSLSGNYEPWVYCVQYRETAFNFISRLMEQEGIYYYFKHEEDKHILVLSDSISSHEPVEGFEEIPFYPPEQSEEADFDRFLEWQISQEVQTTSYTLDDYDFEGPKTDLQTTLTASKKHTGTDYKIFDYPGEYPDTGVGNEYVKYRMEELTHRYETYSASGTARGLMAGCLFSLMDHPRPDQNKEYLVVSATHVMESGSYESGDPGEGELVYTGSIECIDSQVPYRSPRLTPKPCVHGPQTAEVVGPSGEEIWTDKYGRIKVQFHWDRYGKSDENSSCWMRVAQIWAGKGWGAMHLPRIGHEVMIEFLEGDPDRPIVTGRVYNGDNMPPYGLPDNQTQSGIKSRSSAGGGESNFNEIRMEDKKGKEELYIHAEKDRNEVVENDMSTSVGHDQTLTVDNDRTKTVKNDETTTINNNRTETVDNDEKITISGNRTELVSGDETITIEGNRNETVDGTETITVAGDRTVTVSSGGDSLTVSKGDQSVTVSVGDSSTSVDAGNFVVSAGTNAEITGTVEVKVMGAKIALTGDTEICLTVGPSIVKLTPAGVEITGPMITSEAMGVNTITGATVQLN